MGIFSHSLFVALLISSMRHLRSIHNHPAPGHPYLFYGLLGLLGLIGSPSIYMSTEERSKGSAKRFLSYCS